MTAVANGEVLLTTVVGQFERDRVFLGKFDLVYFEIRPQGNSSDPIARWETLVSEDMSDSVFVLSSDTIGTTPFSLFRDYLTDGESQIVTLGFGTVVSAGTNFQFGELQLFDARFSRPSFMVEPNVVSTNGIDIQGHSLTHIDYTVNRISLSENQTRSLLDYTLMIYGTKNEIPEPSSLTMLSLTSILAFFMRQIRLQIVFRTNCGGRNQTCVTTINSRLPVPAQDPPHQ